MRNAHKLSSSRPRSGEKESTFPPLYQGIKGATLYILNAHNKEGAIDAIKYETVIQALRSYERDFLIQIWSKLGILNEVRGILNIIFETKKDVYVAVEGDSPSLNSKPEEPQPREDLQFSEEILNLFAKYNLNPNDPEFQGCDFSSLPALLWGIQFYGPVNRDEIMQALIGTKYLSSLVES